MFPFFKKYSALSLILGIIIALAGTSLLTPLHKTEAFWGIGDTVAEIGSNLVQNTYTAAKTTADFVLSQKGYMKEWVLDPAVRIAAQQLINQATESTVNWINSGFEGEPAYVQDMGGFMTNVADSAAGSFIDQSNLSFLCNSFDVTAALDLTYASRFEDKQTCTLTDVMDNVENFKNNNFSAGGMDGLYSMGVTENNNPYGEYFSAKSEAMVKVSGAKGVKGQMLSQGNGFLSKEVCETGPQGGEYCRTVTPGNVIESQLNSTLQESGIGQLKLADEIDEIVSATIAQLSQQAMQNLSNLGDSNGGGGGQFDDGQFEEPNSLDNRAIEQIKTRTNDLVEREEEYKTSKEDALTALNDTKESLQSLIDCYQKHLSYEKELEEQIGEEYEDSNPLNSSNCHLTEAEEQTARDRIAQASSTISSKVKPPQNKVQSDLAEAEQIITDTKNAKESSISTIEDDSSSTSTSDALNNFMDTVDNFDVAGPQEIDEAVRERNRIQRQMSSIQEDAEAKLEECRSFPPPEDNDPKTPEECRKPLPEDY